jgi:hypothetical protein
VNNESAQVFTASNAAGGRRRRGWSLGTMGAIRRRLARVISDMDADAVDLTKGRALVYGLSTLAGILRDEQALALDERVARLEEREGLTS